MMLNVLNTRPRRRVAGCTPRKSCAAVKICRCSLRWWTRRKKIAAFLPVLEEMMAGEALMVK